MRLGQTDYPQPEHYHWAVAKEPGEELTVDEFWAPEIWTTARYRESHTRRRPGR